MEVFPLRSAGKRPRRENGEGCIYQLADGGWRGYISLNGGRRKWLCARTKADVRKKLREAQRAVERGVDLTSADLTVGAWCVRWLSGKRRIEPTTKAKYETIVRVHVLPSNLSRIMLRKVRAEDVDDWMNALESTGLGAARRKSLLTLVRSALRAAEARGYLPRGNVALHSEMPRETKRHRDAPDPDRVSRLLAVVQNDPRLEAFVLLALGGGLRRGEVLGLTWSAIDFDAGRIEVLARVNRIKGQGLVVRPGAKSDAGERTTFVAQFVVESLKRLHTRV
jgi:integrase